MMKALLAGTAALAIAGSSLVYAQQRGPEGPQGRGFDHAHPWRPSPEDAAAFADARIAALRAGLRLTAEQEKNWPAFEAAARDFAKQRRERAEARRDQQPPANPVERLRRGAEALTSAGANLKRLADAQEPLYNSLDENQKRRFAMLSRMGRGGGGGQGFGRQQWRERFDNWHGRRTDWPDGHETTGQRPAPMTGDRI